nr:hypothetical protein CFP56_09119 [Quercus suber]
MTHAEQIRIDSIDFRDKMIWPMIRQSVNLTTGLWFLLEEDYWGSSRYGGSGCPLEMLDDKSASSDVV